MCYSQGIITKKTLQVVQTGKRRAEIEKKVIQNSRCFEKCERGEVDAVGFNEILK